MTDELERWTTAPGNPRDGRPRPLPTLAEALASAGVDDAAAVASAVARAMPPGRAVAARLGVDDDPAWVVRGRSPGHLAEHGRVVGCLEGFTFLALRDAVVSLHRAPGREPVGGTGIRAVASGTEGLGATSLEELAALAGETWLGDDEVAALGWEPTHPAWIAMRGRVSDVLVASPDAGIGSVMVGEPAAPGAPPQCEVSGEMATPPGSTGDVVRMILHAIGRMPWIGARRLREGAHHRFASSWEDAPAMGLVVPPWSTGTTSAAMAAATTRAARARTLAWLVDTGADADLVARVGREWGMGTPRGTGDGGGPG